MIRAFLVVSLLTQAIALGAVKYQFTRTSTENPLLPSIIGTVLIDENRYRIEFGGEYENQTGYGVAISQDGGQTEQALNAKRKTYFDAAKAPLRGWGDSRLFAMPVTGKKSPTVKRLQIELTEEPTNEEIAGVKVRKYILRFSYQLGTVIQGNKLQSRMSAIALLWAAPDMTIPRLPIEPMGLRTGHPSVDEEVRKKLSGIPGFIVKKQLSVTRILDGGPRYTDLVTSTITSIKSVEATPRLFEVPKGYRYEEPVHMGPGVVARE